MICKRCEQTYSDALNTCPYCGAPREPQQGQQQYGGQPQYGQVPPQQQYGQPPYGQAPQQPPYGQAPYGQPPYGQAPPQVPDSRGKGTGAGSLVCGILGLIFCWVPFLGLILNIVAIALYGSSHKYGPNGMATAGLVLGIIGIIVSIIVTIVMLVAFAAVGTAAMIAAPFL